MSNGRLIWKKSFSCWKKERNIYQIITKEMGKAIKNARYEVGSTIAFFKWYGRSEKGIRRYSGFAPNKRISVIRTGRVVGAITPWNFPLSMGARKLGPALAVGCTVDGCHGLHRCLPWNCSKSFTMPACRKGSSTFVIGSTDIVDEMMESTDVKKYPLPVPRM